MAGTQAAHDAPPAPPRQTNLALSLTQMSMTNGLRVVLVRDPRAVEVSVTMRYRVGFVDDPPGQEGMAHLVEHLMFQQLVGADTIFAREVNDATEFTGLTQLDSTTYSARAPRERLDEFLMVEAARLNLRCTTISDSVFERERQVVINEVRWRDAGSQLVGAILGALYAAGHPYHRTPESEQSVGAITRAQACAFADAHYTPGNAVLVISGNLDALELQASLRKSLVPITGRDAAPPVAVPVVAAAGRALEVPAPIDDDALVIAWPLPADPKLRAQVRAVADVMAAIVDGRVRGHAAVMEFGDDRAPMIGITVQPSTAETLDQARRGAELGIAGTARAFAPSGSARFDRFAWDMTTQAEIAKLFHAFEDGGGRDANVAGYVLAGIDPGEAMAAQMQAVRDLTRVQAASIAKHELALERATVLTLRHESGKKRGEHVAIAAPIHDQGQRRDVDPGTAHQPLDEPTTMNGFAGVRTRTLANGLQVVLLPLTNMPTVDVRLVIDSGTADEPAVRRGAALVAAYALEPSVRDVEDVIMFLASGSSLDVEVGTDHTSFAARGLDMHVDLLLTGLARLVRDGRYNSTAVAAALRRHAKQAGEDSGSLTDAWRRALYGPIHPYVEAGVARRVSDQLQTADGIRFRDAHYTPDNATLVVAGQFDAELADRWIDYLFADWHGTGLPRESPHVKPEAASLARDEDTSSVTLGVSIPVTTGTAATRRIAAAMLDDIVRDVRHQLGASYVIDASLHESRLATRYTISGAIDATRAKEAIELIRTRIAALRDGSDDTARAFVVARHRVYGHLLGVTGTASGLADRVERDVDLGRRPLTDIATAGMVRRTRIDDMAATFAELDLARAAIMMRGPRADVEAAFDALGRKPRFFR